MDNIYTNNYYQSPMDSPPKTPSSASKFFHPKLGRGNSPPLVNGYFTPPDSRENSPSLRGNSPNPQSRNNSPSRVPSFLEGSPVPSFNGSATRSSRKSPFGSKFSDRPSPDLQGQRSWSRDGSLKSLQLAPEPIEIAIPPVTHSGTPPTQGTFGRTDSHRYQRVPVITSPPQTPEFDTSPKQTYRKSSASTIVPLPSTVYVPGVGDTVSSVGSEKQGWYTHRRDRSVSAPTPLSSLFTPLRSERSPSMSSPFLPLEPETPPMAPHHPLLYSSPSMPSSQVELVGLWNAAKGSARGVQKPKDSGKTYILNMYRQAPHVEPEMSDHPLAFPEHFAFGPNAQTPFYSIHARRENPADDTFSELSLLRRDPTTGLDSSVVTLGLEPPSRRISPAGDGLITLIYPKEAVLSAMAPSTPAISEKAQQILGPRRGRGDEERAREAIQKAYTTECCRLSWNAQRRRYYLYHPGVGNGGDAYLVEIEGEVGFDNLGAKGSIKLINVDTNETLTELDFARKLLFINTRATSKIPSDHIVDVAVSTVLTVATVEGRRMRMVRRSMSEYTTQPASRSRSSSRHASSRNSSRVRSEKKRHGCLSGLLKTLCF